MGWSLPLGTVKGTVIRVHITFLLFLAWIGAAAYARGGQESALQSLLYIVLLFLCVLLHEFAHAVHAHVVGSNSPQVLTAYNQAIDRKLYEEAEDVYGRTIKPYARKNDHEYFAEVSCAYLDKLHYFPFTRADLQKHDPAAYKLMEAVWGKAKDLDKALKTENEKAAATRVSKAKQLLAEKRTKDEGVRLLKYVNTFLADTTAAKEAKKLLDKHAPDE